MSMSLMKDHEITTSFLDGKRGQDVRDPSRKAAGHVKSMPDSDQLTHLSLTTRR